MKPDRDIEKTYPVTFEVVEAKDDGTPNVVTSEPLPTRVRTRKPRATVTRKAEAPRPPAVRRPTRTPKPTPTPTPSATPQAETRAPLGEEPTVTPAPTP